MKIGFGYNSGGGVPPPSIKYTSTEAIWPLTLFLETSLNSINGLC